MVVVITGVKRSGKDTVAAYLLNRMIDKKYALADPIREVCKTIFDWKDEDFQGEKKEQIDSYWRLSPRQAMQWIGTEAFQYYIGNDFPLFKKEIGRCIWVYKFLKWRDKFPYSSIVISDLRFHHELDTLEENLGNEVISMRVNNNRINPDNTHASEQDIPDLNVDYDIDNSGNLFYLYSQLNEFLDYYRTRRMEVK